MLLTENEAITKWCPHVRINQGNNITTVGTSTSCVASGCTQWRWFDAAPFAGVPRNQAEADALNRGQAPRRGYCGLAGVPNERMTIRPGYQGSESSRLGE